MLPITRHDMLFIIIFLLAGIVIAVWLLLALWSFLNVIMPVSNQAKRGPFGLSYSRRVNAIQLSVQVIFTLIGLIACYLALPE